MFTLIILLILLPVTFLPLTLATQFSPAELDEMGICLETAEGPQAECLSLPCNSVIANLTAACGNA